jgi:hypothetical protein
MSPIGDEQQPIDASPRVSLGATKTTTCGIPNQLPIIPTSVIPTISQYQVLENARGVMVIVSVGEAV